MLKKFSNKKSPLQREPSRFLRKEKRRMSMQIDTEFPWRRR